MRLPLASSRATRTSGTSKRTCSAAITHAGGRGAGDVSAAGVAINRGVCARAGSSPTTPAVAATAKTAARRKKRWRCMMRSFVPAGSFFSCFDACLLTHFGVDRSQMGGIDDHGSNAATDTVMHAVSEHVVLAGSIKIKSAGVGPVPHDGKPVEQGDLVLLRHHTHVIGVRTERNHDVGPRAVLHVHQNDVRAALKSSGSILRMASRVPVCHITKSGFSSTSSLAIPRAKSSALMRVLTRVTTLTATDGSRRLSASSSRAG